MLLFVPSMTYNGRSKLNLPFLHHGGSTKSYQEVWSLRTNFTSSLQQTHSQQYSSILDGALWPQVFLPCPYRTPDLQSMNPNAVLLLPLPTKLPIICDNGVCQCQKSSSLGSTSRPRLVNLLPV
jgi:hypothetical protein